MSDSFEIARPKYRWPITAILCVVMMLAALEMGGLMPALIGVFCILFGIEVVLKTVVTLYE